MIHLKMNVMLKMSRTLLNLNNCQILIYSYRQTIKKFACIFYYSDSGYDPNTVINKVYSCSALSAFCIG